VRYHTLRRPFICYDGSPLPLISQTRVHLRCWLSLPTLIGPSGPSHFGAMNYPQQTHLGVLHWLSSLPPRVVMFDSQSQSTYDGTAFSSTPPVLVLNESQESTFPHSPGDDDSDNSSPALPAPPVDPQTKWNHLFVRVYSDSKSLYEIRQLFPVLRVTPTPS
jgi:hypothetical protein